MVELVNKPLQKNSSEFSQKPEIPTNLLEFQLNFGMFSENPS